ALPGVFASGPRDVAASVMQPTPFTAATSWQGRARAASDAPDDGSLWSTLHANAHRRDSDGQETKGTDPLKGAARNEQANERGLRRQPVGSDCPHAFCAIQGSEREL